MAPYWLVRATATASTIPSPASLKGPVDRHSSGEETLLSGTFVPKQRWCQCMLLTQVMSILSIPLPPSSNHHQRRHSSAGVVQLSPAGIRTSVDELMLDDKKNHTKPLLSCSLIFCSVIIFVTSVSNETMACAISTMIQRSIRKAYSQKWIHGSLQI
ncbi:hypothetical protein EV702DRAFT_326686 [Suillus placidus]|uniref:Uncharacterized protein n=1 Tax=Suillus placidus TaxID=48579 RepID=A0A9P7D317_9AGAM|nr:hypothetical protein EV702DRAFT_326686 [Suillus placidus]